MNEKPAPTLRELYPHLNEEELAQVEDTLEQYLALVLRIFERVEAESQPPEAQLTPNADEVGWDL